MRTVVLVSAAFALAIQVTPLGLRVEPAAAGTAQAAAKFSDKRGKPWIEEQIRQLSSSVLKVRISAAFGLAQSRDARAVRAMANALRTGPVVIKKIAAAALGRMVTSSHSKKLRTHAVRALQAATLDRDHSVRLRAKKSLQRVTRLVSSRQVFVHVQRAKDQSGKGPEFMTARMRSSLRSIVKRTAPQWQNRWPGTLPTSAELSASGTRAFQVIPSIVKIEQKKVGGKVEVHCRVNLRVSPYAGVDRVEKWVEDRTATSSGNGKTVVSNTKRSLRNAKSDCVLAVTEHLAEHKVVPFLKTLVARK